MIEWHKLRDTTGATILLNIGTEIGMPLDACLASTKIVVEELENPLATIAVWQEMALIRNMQTYRGTDEQLGLKVSRRCSASMMGVFGQALASSATLKGARELMTHYRMLGLAFSRFEFTERHNHLNMKLHDLEVPADCQRFCEERGLGGCLSLFSDLLKQPLSAQSVNMRLPAPADPQAYHDFFGVEVRFNAETTDITFERTIDDLPLPTANRKLQLASIRYCDEVVASQAQPLTLSDRITALLEEQDLSMSLEHVAQRLRISSRQLRRHLTKESTSFRQLQLKLKFSRAQALLEAGTAVNQVALELGYSSPASFSRAFKKHTGKNPSLLL